MCSPRDSGSAPRYHPGIQALLHGITQGFRFPPISCPTVTAGRPELTMCLFPHTGKGRVWRTPTQCFWVLGGTCHLCPHLWRTQSMADLAAREAGIRPKGGSPQQDTFGEAAASLNFMYFPLFLHPSVSSLLRPGLLQRGPSSSSLAVCPQSGDSASLSLSIFTCQAG
jgi:hypothetical protein